MGRFRRLKTLILVLLLIFNMVFEVNVANISSGKDFVQFGMNKVSAATVWNDWVPVDLSSLINVNFGSNSRIIDLGLVSNGTVVAVIGDSWNVRGTLVSSDKGVTWRLGSMPNYRQEYGIQRHWYNGALYISQFTKPSTNYRRTVYKTTDGINFTTYSTTSIDAYLWEADPGYFSTFLSTPDYLYQYSGENGFGSKYFSLGQHPYTELTSVHISYADSGVVSDNPFCSDGILMTMARSRRMDGEYRPSSGNSQIIVYNGVTVVTTIDAQRSLSTSYPYGMGAQAAENGNGDGAIYLYVSDNTNTPSGGPYASRKLFKITPSGAKAIVYTEPTSGSKNVISASEIAGNRYVVTTNPSIYTGVPTTLTVNGAEVVTNVNTSKIIGDSTRLYTVVATPYGNTNTSIAYKITNTSPTVNITTPSGNGVYSEGDTGIIPAITVSDPDNNTLTCKYYIDSEATARETKTVSNTLTAKTVSFSPFNMGTLTEGSHTMKFEVIDGFDPLVIKTVTFKVDKTVPTLSAVSVTSTTNGITVSGSATDAIAGMDAYPYRYTISGFNPTSWVTATQYTQSTLTANTKYSVTFEARDAKGHVANKQQNIYTKANVPIIEVTGTSSYGVSLSISKNNPTSTQYVISVNNNTQYVTPEGTLTSSEVWINLPGDNSINVQGLTPETTYTFRAKAKNGDNVQTNWGAEDSGTTLVSPPGSPANIIATATDSTITLSWDAVAGSTGYEVEADGTIVDTGTRTTYTHTGLIAGPPHTYRIRAINEGGPGNWSAPIEKSTLPSSPGVPGNLSAVPLSTTITVTWDNVPGATGYDIEVDGALVTNGPNTNYRHTSLMPGTSHIYRVKSINPGGKSEWSSLITVTTLVDSSPVPVNINTTAGKNQITVTWDAVDGATGYEIEADGVRIYNNTRTSYSHTSLQPGTEHWYRVRSEKGAILSDWSAMTIETTLTDSFGVPENIIATADDTSVLLTWDPVTDAVGYDVEIDGEIIDNGTDTSCTHNGLEPKSSHTYKVRVRSESETSPWSEVQEVTTYNLPAPRNVAVTASENTLTTVWEEVYGAESYDLELDGAVIRDILETEYTCEGLTPGTQHQIRVRAESGNGDSNWSTMVVKSTVSNNFSTPVLTGIARKNSITLVWNSVSDNTAYDLEIDGTITENITGAKYIHDSLETGTSHTYRVRTKAEAAAGDWSSLLTVSTLSEKPAVPTNIAASSGMTAVQVSWDNVAGATSYEIEVDGVVLGNGTGTSYLHQNLQPGTAHTYRIRAVNAGGFSDWSEALVKNTVSSVQTFEIESTAGDEFNLMLSAAGIQDIGAYTFTVTYSVEAFDVLDLCALTSRIDTTTGNITGTDIKIAQYEPGTIVFTKGSTVQSYEVWSGIVNSIRFKAKQGGQSAITYSIN